MVKRIVVIQGHPDPDPARFCDALALAYQRGALAAGHEVLLIRAGERDIPLLRSQSDFEQGKCPETLADIQRAILHAQHIVIVFPLWLGGAPALLKALLEQVMRPGAVFEPGRTGRWPQGRLRGISARVVVTMAMPALVYRLWYRAAGVKSLIRSILNFVGVSPVATSYIGMVAGGSPADRERWLRRMEEFGTRAA